LDILTSREVEETNEGGEAIFSKALVDVLIEPGGKKQ
jgi:hypothetical protein